MNWFRHLLGLVVVAAAFPLAVETVSAQETTAAEDVDAARTGPDKEYFQQGRFVYQKNCIVCHGRFGEGDGELVKDWEVLPRNFRKANFKYRSTPYGKLPTDADLTRTIRRGIAGSAMPVFSQLQDDEVRAVIEYLKFFSQDWRNPEKLAEPVALDRKPAWFANDQLRTTQEAFGRALFRDTCAPCHGKDGAGDGPAAVALKDSDGKSIRPAELRPPLKSGPEAEDLYRTIMTGITGTPMMGFHGSLKPEEAWQIAAYVRTLKSEKP